MNNFAGATRALANQDILVFYSGLITQDVIETLAGRLRLAIGGGDDARKIVHALFTTFVELAQNVIHHGCLTDSADQQGELGHYGSLAAGKDGDRYYVAAGSVVLKSKKPEIEKLFSAMNQLDYASLNEKYHDQKKIGRNSSGDRAGIGLFWVVRRAGKPLEFSFEGYDEAHDLFTIKVSL